MAKVIRMSVGQEQRFALIVALLHAVSVGLVDHLVRNAINLIEKGKRRKLTAKMDTSPERVRMPPKDCLAIAFNNHFYLTNLGDEKIW